MYCIYCGTQFDAYAIACLNCGKPRARAPAVPQAPLRPAAADASQLRWLLPVGRSFYAIVAGYLGLLSIFPVLAQLAVIFGLLGLRDIRQHPEKSGSGRAWFGIIAGGCFSLLHLLLLLTGGK
jgi:hypothetical protein